MYKNETNSILSFLTKKITDEERYLTNENKIFYYTYRLNKYILVKCSDNNEYFFIVLIFKNYAIFYNDIEDEFGICAYKKPICDECNIYNGSLNDSIQRINIQGYGDNDTPHIPPL